RKGHPRRAGGSHQPALHQLLFSLHKRPSQHTGPPGVGSGVAVKGVKGSPGESADGLPGPPGRQGEPGDRVRQTSLFFLMSKW
ncbi:unnamed protein product, partial [Tetraodon nigroviridis]